MAATERVTITNVQAGQRLDLALAALTGRSRAQIGKLLRLNLVTDQDQHQPKAADKAILGHRYTILEPAPAQPPTALPDIVPVIYEDDAILVVNKPAGLTTHPGNGVHQQETLAEYLHRVHPATKRAVIDSLEEGRAGIVHRLDKPTSGVMVVAKTTAALATLKQAFRERTVAKEYLAICYDSPAERVVAAPLGPHPRRWWLRAVVESGKPAETSFTIEKRGVLLNRPASLVRARPRTGRTHQIRVHLAYVGAPILGDPLYHSPASQELSRLLSVPRLMLHAETLTFPHPTTGESVTFTAPTPADFAHLVKDL